MLSTIRYISLTIACPGLLVLFLGCSDGLILAPEAANHASAQACWGQATRVYAQMGELGEHASQQTNPRVGLRNLARALAEEGVLEEPTLQALGAFVASTLGLSVEACA